MVVLLFDSSILMKAIGVHIETCRAFKKSVSDVVLSRRAIAYMNSL